VQFALIGLVKLRVLVRRSAVDLDAHSAAAPLLTAGVMGSIRLWAVFNGLSALRFTALRGQSARFRIGIDTSLLLVQHPGCMPNSLSRPYSDQSGEA